MASSTSNPQTSSLAVAMTSQMPREESLLESLPVELIQEIMKTMGPRELSKFVLLSKRLFIIFKANQAVVLSRVLLSQPEFETMLYMYTTDERDFRPGQMLYPRIIDFLPKAVNFDWDDDSGSIKLLSANDLDDRRPWKIALQMWDMISLWKWLMVIDWWVELYPVLRWRDHPEDRRCLRPQEEARLRKALARWWLYAWHFQGCDFHRDLYLPHKWRDDNRLRHIRVMSTREICELEDLWGLVFDTISHDLCSSLERVKTEKGYSVELVPWGSDDGRHNNIVNTYLKLDPEQLKYFLELYHRRKKMDIIKAVRSSMREFNLDRETLSYAITTVLQERMMLKPNEITNVPRSGIIDEDRDDVKQCDIWSTDASPNGLPPLSQEKISAFPVENDKRLAYGDDGSDEPF